MEGGEMWYNSRVFFVEGGGGLLEREAQRGKRGTLYNAPRAGFVVWCISHTLSLLSVPEAFHGYDG